MPVKGLHASLALLVGYGVLLVTVPYGVDPPPEVTSAASLAGYSTEAAYAAALAWSLLGVLALALWHRGLPPDPEGEEAPPGALDWREIGAVFAVFALAYFPLFLARHGPIGEDDYFLTSLHRMACGQVPFRDLGFLYGPMMLYPAYGFSQLFGFSMTSYYAFVALMEGLQYALLAATLQVFLPDRRQRWTAFALLLPFLFDTMLGLNWSGLRRLVPVWVALLLAVRPYDRRALCTASVTVGLHVAYSHEYALAGLGAVGAPYLLALLRGEGWRAFSAGAVLGIGSLVVWWATVALVMGDDVAAYFAHLTDIVGIMSSGHAGFRFYWTANSLALFGLLAVACAAVGSGLLRRTAGPLLSGDRLLLSGLLYALVVLKSGMNRCDHWHLTAPFLVLIFAFLLPLPSRYFPLGRAQRSAGTALVAVASLTYLVGIAPMGSLYAETFVRGAFDVVSGRGHDLADETRTGAIEFERSETDGDRVALGRYLAAPERRDLPVYFYGRAWNEAPRVGVCREAYALDDLMYTERARPPVETLAANPDALVLMKREAYDRLYGDRPRAGEDWLELTATKQLGRWLSTVHYDAAATEARLQNEARDATTGAWVREHYSHAREFGGFVVLSR